MPRLRTFACLIAFGALALGCGPKFDAYAKVDGPFIEVDVHRLQKGDIVSVVGQSATLGYQSHLEFQIPADKFSAGDQKLEVSVERAGKKASKTVKVEIPASALAPQLLLSRCIDAPIPPKDPESSSKVALSYEIEALGTRDKRKFERQYCQLHADGRAHMPVSSNGDASVIIGGKSVKLTAGKGDYAVELSPLLRSLRGGDPS